MRKPVYLSHAVAAGLAVTALFLNIPAQAEGLSAGARPVSASPGSNGPGDDMAASQKLRRLDIMLMVTGLRCRTTQDDFQADFQAFEAHHLLELNAAAQMLVAQYAGSLGPMEANRALDRISVQFANQYGNGHPWLGCHELKFLTQQLAHQDGREVLVQAADEIFSDDGPLPVVGAVLTGSTPFIVPVAVPNAFSGNSSLAHR